MIRKFFLVAFVFLSSVAFAQQLPQYSQYMFNKIAYNPGYAGAGNGICVGGLIRQQWVGFKETDDEGNSSIVAPETYVVSINAPVRALRGGLGATIIQDKIAFQNNITLNLMYAYQTTLGAGDLGIGVQLSLLNKTIDFTKYNPPTTTDDPLLNEAEQSDMIFDAGIGIYYRVPDNYYLGLSVLQLLESETAPDATSTKLKRQINLIGGYEFSLPNTPEIDVLPSLMIKTDGSSVQYDLTALLRFKNQFWGGVSYRYQDAIAIILGMEYKNFNIGYSYDINTSAIGSYGSHEIRVGYCFKIEVSKIKKVYRNTRFL
jgi:type IX secretion system PorP/SprF family membrane protein